MDSRKKDHKGMIGLVITNGPMTPLNNSFWTTIIAELTEQLKKMDFKLAVFNPSAEDTREGLFNRLSLNHSVDGYIVSSDSLEVDHLKPLIKAKIPYVIIGTLPGHDCYNVDIDNVDAGYKLTCYMIQKGFKKICYLSSPLDTHFSQERVKGYLQAMAEEELTPRTIAIGNYRDEDIQETMAEVLKTWTDLEGMIMGAGPESLLHVLWTLRSEGIDLTRWGITVFDDFPFMEFMNPPLTALRQPLDLMSSKAVELIMGLINGNPVKEKSHLLPISIIGRGSCGDTDLST